MIAIGRPLADQIAVARALKEPIEECGFKRVRGWLLGLGGANRRSAAHRGEAAEPGLHGAPSRMRLEKRAKPAHRRVLRSRAPRRSVCDHEGGRAQFGAPVGRHQQRAIPSLPRSSSAPSRARRDERIEPGRGRREPDAKPRGQFPTARKARIAPGPNAGIGARIRIVQADRSVARLFAREGALASRPIERCAVRGG